MWTKIWVVTAREYIAAVRTKSFIASVLLMPLMMGGSIFAQRMTQGIVDVTDKRVAVIDHTGGRMFRDFAAANETRNATQIVDRATGKQNAAKFVFEKLDAPPGNSPEASQLRYDLSRQIESSKLFAIVEIGKDIYNPGLPTGDVGALSKAATKPGAMLDPDALFAAAADALGDDNVIRYTSNRLTYTDLREFLQATATRSTQGERMIRAGLKMNLAEIGRLLSPAFVATKGLVNKDAAGKLKEEGKTGQFVAFVRPIALTFLMFIIVLVGVSPLATNIIEEKNLRIAEVLLGSLRPFELMAGKLLGGVGVALTLGVMYLTVAWFGLQRAVEGFDITAYLNSGVVIWFVLFTILATLLFGSLFVAAGAAVTNVKEAQALITPIMLMIVLPLIFLKQLLNDPAGPIAMALTFFPFSAPMVVVARMSIPPGIPLWQGIAGAISTVLATVVMVWAAGRVFRVGMLASGSRASLGQMLRWIFSRS